MHHSTLYISQKILISNFEQKSWLISIRNNCLSLLLFWVCVIDTYFSDMLIDKYPEFPPLSAWSIREYAALCFESIVLSYFKSWKSSLWSHCMRRWNNPLSKCKFLWNSFLVRCRCRQSIPLSAWISWWSIF